MTLTVTNQGLQVGSLVWTTNSTLPNGATLIDNRDNTATFSWRPLTAGTNTIGVRVEDAQRIFSDVKYFTVAVSTTTAATPPSLTLPTNHFSVVIGSQLTFTATATNTDGSTNALTFSLASPEPTNNPMSIDPTSGFFSWTPTASSTRTNAVVVTEHSSPTMTATQSFTVDVLLTNNCATFEALLSAITNGGVILLSNCPTIVLSNTLVISNEVTLLAPSTNVLITGNNSVRLFNVLNGGRLTLQGVTLSGGKHTSGGAINVNSGGSVTAINCAFSSNVAAGADGDDGEDGDDETNIGQNGGNGTDGISATGGAVYNNGELFLSRCQFLSNSVAGGNGGSGGNGGNGGGQGGNGGRGGAAGSAFGGVVYSTTSGTLTMIDCTFQGNSATGGRGGDGGTNGLGPFRSLAGSGGAGGAGSGAAVYVLGSSSISNCTFWVNVAKGGESPAAGGATDSGNGANGKVGGASLGGGVCNLGTSVLVNCTFATNQVLGGKGGDGGDSDGLGGDGGNGGLASGGGLYSSLRALVTNCTFSGSSAVGGTNGVGGLAPFPGDSGNNGASRGGNIALGAGTISVANSIFAFSPSGNNGYGTLSDRGHNISSDSSLNFSGTIGNNTDPKLLALADYGGSTRTMGLQGGSKAINAAGTLCPETDQRGKSRPQGPACDIGAFEGVTPLISTQPEDKQSTNGGTVTFSVVADGDAPLRYQWRFNGTNKAGATASSYTVSNVSITNAGEYTVRITNAFGSVISEVATLTIIGPRITVQPLSQAVRVGSNVTFSVTVEGEAPFTYQWRFNSSAIPGATASSLTVTNVQPANAGTYSVSVANSQATIISAGAVLTVQQPPSILSQPISQTAVPGSSVTFSVTAEGSAPLSYRWYFNGASVATGPDYTFVVQTDKAGAYTVVVTNAFGAVTSAPAILSVGSFSISGQVLEGTNGKAGVTVEAQGDVSRSAVTGADGRYAITNVESGEFVVSARLQGYNFSAPITVVVDRANVTNVNFSVTARLLSISGHVTYNGGPFAGVTIKVSGLSPERYPVTDANGFYSIADLAEDTWSVSPFLTNNAPYGFSPPSRVINLTQDVTNADFVAGTTIAITPHADGVVQLSVTGPGPTNRIDASTDLNSWETLVTGPNITNRNGFVFFQFVDTDATNLPVRFYRAVQIR